MALHDSVLGMFRKEAKDPNAPKPAPGSRSEREAKIKDKAGLVINIFALLLAVNTWYSGKLSSTIMNNTISANDTYNFYQAKSIKQTQYQLFSEDTNDAVKSKKWAEKAASYEDGPEGKVALLAKAEQLIADRDNAKKRSPWIGYATTAYQLAIVVLSASILAVSMTLFWSSFAVAVFGIFLSLQGILLWF